MTFKAYNHCINKAQGSAYLLILGLYTSSREIISVKSLLCVLITWFDIYLYNFFHGHVQT